MAGPTDLVYNEGGGDGELKLVLDHLRWNWGEAYEIGFAGGLFYARRLDDGSKLEESNADKLRDAIFRDYDAKPVPRDLPPPAFRATT